MHPFPNTSRYAPSFPKGWRLRGRFYRNQKNPVKTLSISLPNSIARMLSWLLPFKSSIFIGVTREDYSVWAGSWNESYKICPQIGLLALLTRAAGAFESLCRKQAVCPLRAAVNGFVLSLSRPRPNRLHICQNRIRWIDLSWQARIKENINVVTVIELFNWFCRRAFNQSINFNINADIMIDYKVPNYGVFSVHITK